MLQVTNKKRESKAFFLCNFLKLHYSPNFIIQPSLYQSFFIALTVRWEQIFSQLIKTG